MRNWFKAQKFEKKAASGSDVKKGETKLPSKLGDLGFNEDKPTGERWYEGEMGGQRVRILQEKVGKDDWWVAEISGRNVVDDNNKAMKFDNVQDALEEVKQEIKSSELPKVNLFEKDFTRHVDEEAAEEYPNAKLKLHYYQADRVGYFDSEGQKEQLFRLFLNFIRIIPRAALVAMKPILIRLVQLVHLEQRSLLLLH